MVSIARFQRRLDCNLSSVLLACCIIPSLRASCLGQPIEELLAGLKTSTDAATVQSFALRLVEQRPKSKKDIHVLLEAMRDKRLAPYAQKVMAQASEPSLGPALHEGLTLLRKELRPATTERFEKLPREEQDEAVRQVMNLGSVIRALGNVKYKPAASDLRRLLDQEGAFEEPLVGAASWALGEMGDEKAFEAIMAKVDRGKPVSVSGYGVRSIRRIMEKIEKIEATYKTKPKTRMDPREMQIHDLTERIAGTSKDDPAVKAELRLLLRHPREEVRRSAAAALVWSMNPQDKTLNLEMLRHKDSIVRLDGLRSLYLRKTWDKSFLPVLIDLMQYDPEFIVRHGAVETIATVTVLGVRRKELAEAVPYIEAVLKDPDLRYAAFNTLRILTGKFYPYEGIHPVQINRMKQEPAFVPEAPPKGSSGNIP